MPGLRDAAAPFRVALLVPTSGAAGLWGGSSLACAQLAAESWNAAGGVHGREVVLALIDASDENAALEFELSDLFAQSPVAAVVGMHTSSVRERVTAALNEPVPFVYTPLYEGGPLPEHVLAIGETPSMQLLPSLRWLSDRFRLRRWHLLGNDYCWPWRSHRIAVRALAAQGCEITGNDFVPLGQCDHQRMIDDIRAAGAQAVLLSLIGQDAIDFNRAFSAGGLAGKVIRLSCAIEENGLLAIGPDATDGLFVASSYFSALDNDANGQFRERYWSRFGERAPVLNALGQSAYEGMTFLRGLVENRRRDDDSLSYSSVRGARWRDNEHKSVPMYLAEANGMSFDVARSLEPG